MNVLETVRLHQPANVLQATKFEDARQYEVRIAFDFEGVELDIPEQHLEFFCQPHERRIAPFAKARHLAFAPC